MKRCRSVLAALLVLVMTLTPLFGVLSVDAAENLEITGVSGGANTINIATNLSAASLNGNSISNVNLSQYPVLGFSGANADSSGNLVISLTYDKEFVSGQFYALYADSSITLSDGTVIALGKDYYFSYNGSWDMAEKTGDILSGLDFENSGNELHFAGTGEGKNATIERVSYADVNVAAPANGGSYALKVSHASNCWPNFRVNFGKTLKAGTTITFDVYGNYDYEAAEGVTKYMKLELTADSKSFATSADPNQIVWTVVETWRTGLTITLTADSDHVDFFYNVADGNHGDVSSWLLMDNFKAVPVGDFTEGVDFETSGNELYFTGTGTAQDATIERVSYADANVTAPENGGSYALKLSHASDCWPHFRVNFGKTFKAGTTITFDVYGNYDYAAAEGVTKYMKLEIVSKEFATSADSNQVVWTVVETWMTATVTLTAASDHIDFMYNVADGQHGNPSSWMLMDNFKASEPVPVGDIWEGYGFEVEGNQWYFDAVGGDYADRDATFEAVSYTNAGIAAPQNGGEYALRLTHESNQWPTFRLNFSETLSAGTVITFDAYTVDTSNTSKNTISVFEYVSGGDATEEYFYNSWNKLSIVLKSDCDYVDLFSNMDRRNESGSANIEVYLDNFKAVKIDPVGDILEGYGFEKYGNAGYFTGLGMANRDATIERVAYNELDISAPANGDSYALKLSNPSDRYPTFRIDFGKTLHAGSQITFDVYAKVNGASKDVPCRFGFNGDGGSNTAINEFICGVWVNKTITLQTTTDHVDLFWSVDHSNLVEPFSSEIYLDNVIAHDPEAPVGNILEGYGFEVDGNERFFGGVSGTNAWRDANFEVVSFDGDKALKLTCVASQWPTFRFDFGRTLRAGTVITFDAYTDDTSGIRETVSVFEYVSGGDATKQYYHGSWNTQTITLTTDCSYIDLVCTMDRWNETTASNFAVYIDNVKAVQPPVGDIMCSDGGYSFEVDGNELYFTGVGVPQDISIERASYADDEVTAPANGGESALKVSHTSNCWPNFRLNFDETLKAGTIITFDFYGNYTSDASEKYMKLELTVDSKSFATTADPNQVVWTLVETWNTATITLTAEADHVDLFYNVADSKHGEVASYILIDNVRAHTPGQAVQENVVDATCTSEGSYDTVIYCTRDDCGVELSRSHETVPALGHEYVSKASYINKVPTITHSCSRCGDVQTIELNFYGSTVYMGNTLAVYYYTDRDIDGIELDGGKKLPGFTDISVNFSYGERKVHYDEEGNVVNDYSLTVSLDDAIKNNEDYYKFPCRYITPSQIGDDITAIISGTFNGEPYSFTMTGYSVKQYCLNRLDDSTSNVEKAMLVDMLYYCDASRAFTTYKADEELVTNKLTSEQKALHTAERTYNSVLNKASTNIENEKVTWEKAAIELYHCVRMRLSCKPVDGVSVGEVYAKATVNGEAVETYIKQENGVYYVYVLDLAYAQLSEKVYVTLYEGDTQISDTICYSVESYAATMLNDTNENLVALLKAMMCYGDSAKAYFATKNA